MYLPSRWYREASQSEEASQMLQEEIVDQPIDDILCPPISKTKGRPKTKRLQGGKEIQKVTKTCGLCKKVGHNMTTCPEEKILILPTVHKRRKGRFQVAILG